MLFHEIIAIFATCLLQFIPTKIESMKKYIIIMAATMIAIAACKNENKPGSEPATTEVATQSQVTEEKAEGIASYEIKVGSRWHNGYEWYEVFKDEKEEGKLVLRGGTTHEGGFFINMTPMADNKYKAQIPDKEGTFTAEAKTVDSVPCIIIRDENKNVTSVMVKNDNDDEGLREFERKVMARRLAGEYLDRQGERWLLTEDQRYQTGSQKGRYKFEEEFDTPVMTITMEDGKHWIMKVTESNIEMVPAEADESGDLWNELAGEHIYLTLSPESAGKWRYTWASDVLLTVGDVAQYSKEELRIIRNEIWAHHGYNFNSDDLRQRFGAVKDYKPVADNSSVKLTATETLNVEIIKYVESRPEDE